MKLHVQVVEDVDVLTPHGVLSGERQTDEIQQKVKELDQEGRTKLLINLGNTTMMNSLGLGVLFVAHATYAKRGATVKLCCVDKRLEQIFVIVKLILVYGDNIHDTEEQALASFRAMEAVPSR